jgi:hypothetical protein
MWRPTLHACGEAQMTNTQGLAALAQPFTAAELADFEQAILATQNLNAVVARLAKTSLGALMQYHGKDKCDLMMTALDAKYNPKVGA